MKTLRRRSYIFRDCIWQPVYIVGQVGANSAYSSQLNPLLSTYLGRFVIVEVRPHGEMPPINISEEEFDDRVDKGSLVLLRGLDRDTVFAYTEMQDINGRYTGIPYPIGMRKSINRLGDAFNWPNVRYRNILPLDNGDDNNGHY